MGFFNKYPYSDFHELNLDWIIEKVKEVEKIVDDFTVFNTLTWAGVHDASKSYVKWSIVQDASGNGYISIKPVPANVPLTNTSYWQQIANYSTLYAAFNTRITALETTVGDNSSGLVKDMNTAKTDIITLNTAINNLNKKTVLKHFRWYIDGVNGDDTNDGLSWATAFKTLKPIFKKANSTKDGQIDIRMYLANGTYVMPDLDDVNEVVFQHLTFHITGQGSSNTTLRLSNTNYTAKIYECHSNIADLTIDTPFVDTGYAVTGVSFDGGSVAISNVVFLQKPRFLAVKGVLTNCTYPSCEIKYSIMNIVGSSVTNTDNTVNAYDITTSKVQFGGSHAVTELSEAGSTNAFINALGSDIIWKPTYRSLTNMYGYSLKVESCQIMTTPTQYGYFTSRSVNGISNTSGMPSVFFVNTTNIVINA